MNQSPNFHKKLRLNPSEGLPEELIFPELPILPPYFIRNNEVYLMLQDPHGVTRPFKYLDFVELLRKVSESEKGLP